MQVCTLKDLLEAALRGTVPSAWVYLPNTEGMNLETRCMLVPDDQDVEVNEKGIPVEAARLGFAKEGPNKAMLEDVVTWARRFQRPPSLGLLLEGFVYHLRNDALPERPGGAAPPDAVETERAQDRTFYESLGDGTGSAPCQAEGCTGKAITFGTLCRHHHFEMITGRKCPFAD